MSNQIGELFKELNNNIIVKNILNEEDTEENLIIKLMQSEELLLKLKTFIDDENIIKQKIETCVKQILKKKQKPVEKIKESIKTHSCNCDPCECDPCECESSKYDYSDNIYLGKYNQKDDFKNDKVKWIDKDIRLEHIDHLIKMTTSNFEVFY